MSHLCCVLSPKVTCTACEQAMCHEHILQHAVGLLNGSKFSRWFCPGISKYMYMQPHKPGALTGNLVPHYEDRYIVTN